MFVCRSKRLANYLIENGNPVIRIDIDHNSKGYLIFLFKKKRFIKQKFNAVANR